MVSLSFRIGFPLVPLCFRFGSTLVSLSSRFGVPLDTDRTRAYHLETENELRLIEDLQRRPLQQPQAGRNWEGLRWAKLGLSLVFESTLFVGCLLKRNAKRNTPCFSDTPNLFLVGLHVQGTLFWRVSLLWWFLNRNARRNFFRHAQLVFSWLACAGYLFLEGFPYSFWVVLNRNAKRNTLVFGGFPFFRGGVESERQEEDLGSWAPFFGWF